MIENCTPIRGTHIVKIIRTIFPRRQLSINKLPSNIVVFFFRYPVLRMAQNVSNRNLKVNVSTLSFVKLFNKGIIFREILVIVCSVNFSSKFNIFSFSFCFFSILNLPCTFEMPHLTTL